MGLKTSTRVSGLLFITLISACAHAPEPASQEQPRTDSAQTNLTKLQERVQDLEARISALNDKINLQNGIQPSAKLESKIGLKPDTPVEAELPLEKVSTPAAHGRIIPKPKSNREIVHEEGFKSDEAIDRYREAKILFDSGKYSDAVIEFSEFVKNEPNHPLASSAQYFLGMSYFKQNEFKLAEEELSRGLIAYPHSNYIPDTLRSLADVSDQLKKDSRANYYRQKLLSLFPNSPQAKNVTLKNTELNAHRVAAGDDIEEPKLLERPTAPIQPEAPQRPTEDNQE